MPSPRMTSDRDSEGGSDGGHYPPVQGGVCGGPVRRPVRVDQPDEHASGKTRRAVPDHRVHSAPETVRPWRRRVKEHDVDVPPALPALAADDDLVHVAEVLVSDRMPENGGGAGHDNSLCEGIMRPARSRT